MIRVYDWNGVHRCDLLADIPLLNLCVSSDDRYIIGFFPRTGKSDVADLICRKRFTDDSPIPFGKGTDNDSAPAKNCGRGGTYRASVNQQFPNRKTIFWQ